MNGAVSAPITIEIGADPSALATTLLQVGEAFVTAAGAISSAPVIGPLGPTSVRHAHMSRSAELVIDALHDGRSTQADQFIALGMWLRDHPGVSVDFLSVRWDQERQADYLMAVVEPVSGVLGESVYGGVGPT